MRYEADKVRYQEVLVNGKFALFTDVRIEKETVPKGLYMYQVRHDEEDWSEPIQVKNYILVNFLGTLITKEPLLTNDETSIYILAEEDWEEIGTCSRPGLEVLRAIRNM